MPQSAAPCSLDPFHQCSASKPFGESDPVMLEIELKFALDDPVGFEQRLSEFGFQPAAQVRQADHYFNHPSRDFAVTDEAFRLRVVGDHAEFTYKGPRLDKETKTRFEIELPLQSTGHHEEAAKKMLEALGFRPVASVVKNRRQGTLQWQGETVTVARDSLVEIGEFTELELVVAEERRDQAREIILSLAKALELESPIHRSYLGLVMEARAREV
jgi:adenylate cyclase class 2